MTHEFAGSGAATVVQPDSSHPDIIKLPDADWFLSGAFQRAGLDLHLHGDDGQHLVVPGYFASAHPPALMAPNGVRMGADAVALLAGQHAEVRPGMTADDAAHHAGPN